MKWSPFALTMQENFARVAKRYLQVGLRISEIWTVSPAVSSGQFARKPFDVS